MSEPTPPPTLTPQFCFNEGALREFLRLSRSSIDDSISTHLNALVTPSTTNPLNPSNNTTITTAAPPSPPTMAPRQPSTRPIPLPTCNAFKSTVLFPTWHSRTSLLEYCTHVATSPDPDDPTLPLRQLESEAVKNRVVNERLDPYSGRFFPREARTERLGSTLRLEWGVERIVRRRTWAVVGERCGKDGVEEGGQEEMMGGGVRVGLGVDGPSVSPSSPSSSFPSSSMGREGWEVALDKWREDNSGLVEGKRR